tara:strand:+ start:97479 stop:97895 length:417 start_codon:yes stop_codon:yes gene_type:complete
MLDKLYKLSKLWSFQEKQIRNRCQQVTIALENEKVQVEALEQFYQEYLINDQDIVGLELKEKIRFCDNLGHVVQLQKKGLYKLEQDQKQLQKLHAQFSQKILILNNIIAKRKAIVDSNKLKKEFKQMEDLYRQFKQFQ